MKHWLVTNAFATMYIVWTVIHAFAVEQNPYVDDDNISLYTAVDWVNAPWYAASLSIVVLFVILPLFHLIIWTMSYVKRRYTLEGGGKEIVLKAATEEKDEERAIMVTVH
jgi:hypothetical protein